MSKPEGALEVQIPCDLGENMFVDMTVQLTSHRKELSGHLNTRHYEIAAHSGWALELARVRDVARNAGFSVVVATDDDSQGDEWTVTQFALDSARQWHVDTIWSPGA